MDFEEQVKEILSTVEFGDLIEFSYPIGYSHWAVYDQDGYVFHFAVADEGRIMNTIRTYIQSVANVCGDLLLGQTKIRRMLLSEVNVPNGVRTLISNSRHGLTPSAPEKIKQRRDALLDKEFSYDLLSFNCEHFATFVRYGKAMCNQIPFKIKNKECEETTAVFNEFVISKKMDQDLFS